MDCSKVKDCPLECTMKFTEWPQFQPEIFRNIRNLPQAQLVGFHIFSCLIMSDFKVRVEGNIENKCCSAT